MLRALRAFHIPWLRGENRQSGWPEEIAARHFEFDAGFWVAMRSRVEVHVLDKPFRAEIERRTLVDGTTRYAVLIIDCTLREIEGGVPTEAHAGRLYTSNWPYGSVKEARRHIADESALARAHWNYIDSTPAWADENGGN
jgi:hypothetical protein